jgi:hypothetical protein
MHCLRNKARRTCGSGSGLKIATLQDFVRSNRGWFGPYHSNRVRRKIMDSREFIAAAGTAAAVASTSQAFAQAMGAVRRRRCTRRNIRVSRKSRPAMIA